MDPEAFRARAAHYRWLAHSINDVQAIEGLLAMAAELEERADEAAATRAAPNHPERRSACPSRDRSG
jgi:hypothetical protein